MNRGNMQPQSTPGKHDFTFYPTKDFVIAAKLLTFFEQLKL